MASAKAPEPPYTGGCHCGAHRYSITSKPARLTLCHCVTCRQLTGAPFLPFFNIPRASLTWTRDSPARKTLQLSSVAARTFCSACGTQLTMQFDGRSPDRISLTAGSLDVQFDGVLAGVLRDDAYACASQIFVSQVPEWGGLAEWEGAEVRKYDRFPDGVPDIDD